MDIDNLSMRNQQFFTIHFYSPLTQSDLRMLPFSHPRISFSHPPPSPIDKSTHNSTTTPGTQTDIHRASHLITLVTSCPIFIPLASNTSEKKWRERRGSWVRWGRVGQVRPGMDGTGRDSHLCNHTCRERNRARDGGAGKTVQNGQDPQDGSH